MANVNEELKPNIGCLTRREWQVARLVQEGLSNKEIATQLGISERTVKFHVSLLLKKTGAGNRIRLGRMLLENGLAVVELSDSDQVMADKVAKYHQQEATLERRLRFVKGMIQVMEDYISQKEPGQVSSLPSRDTTMPQPLKAVVPIRAGHGHG